MSIRRILREMAGELPGRDQRNMQRQARKEQRVLQGIKQFMQLGEKIERRQRRDPDLPPMPFDFEEQRRRAEKGGK